MKLLATPQHAGDTVLVAVSKRNLLSLLVKLDGYPLGSVATLERREPGQSPLILKAESDLVHYDGREAGPMHPDTEDAMGKLISPVGKPVVVLEWDDADDEPHTEVFSTDAAAVDHADAIPYPRTMIHRTVR